MSGVRIFNICCQAGSADNNVVERAWQMTDISVLKSITGKKPGWRMTKQDDGSTLNTDKKISTKRTTARYIARELIWKVGRWKNMELADFVRDIKPDILYLPVYRSGYMCDVQQYVMKLADCPVVCHITDDVYSYPPKPLHQPLKTLYYWWMRKKIKKIIQKSEYGEVFAQNMSDSYAKLFNKQFFIIGKGVDLDKTVDNTIWNDDGYTTFVYTGNYGGERGRQLISLAKAIAKLYPKGSAELAIYSGTSADKEVDKQLKETGVVRLCGSVIPDKVQSIQREADYLVHVEGFSEKSIMDTRMSFSTKLIDYMLAQRPILAIGPSDINSIQVLIQNDIAIVACSETEIETTLGKISRHVYDDNGIVKRASDYVINNRDLKKIQHGMRCRLSAIIGKHGC